MTDERVLVTGGTGCIGAWVVRNLVHEHVPVLVLTSSGRDDRLRLILDDAERDAISFVAADISDIAALELAADGTASTGSSTWPGCSSRSARPTRSGGPR